MIKIDQIKYVIVTDFIEKARKFSHVAMKNICIISDYKNHEFLGIRSHFSFVVVQFEVEMNEVALRTLLNWLLTCNALFDGPMPNLAEFKVFEYDDGEIRMKTLDWNGSFASSQIYISDTIEGANLQMVVSGEKIELGGQVTVKIRGAYLGHCPVAGDTSEVRVVIDKGLCSPDFLVYRIKDRLYAIGQNGWTASRIISLYGSVIEERKVSVVAKDNFGVNQTKGTLVYKDGYGMCQELTAGSLSSSWESRFCDDEKITLVPNETSEWHHVQYLQIVHNCELDPAIPRDELKNVYVRFMHVPPKPKARRRGLLTERGKVLVGLSAGFLGVVLIAFVGSAPFWYKWSPWGGAWRREKKPVPNTDLEKDGWSSNRDRDDDAPRDSYGNVDWNLLTRDYRDQYRDVDFKETFNDEDFGLPLPKITDDSFSLRFRYEHVKTLSHGKMRAVHQYGIGGGSFVAIKFMVAKDEVEMERAKQEIALLRFFWESHKSNQESPVCLRCAARKNPGLRRSKTRRQSCAPMRTSQECDQDHAQERKEPHLAKVGDSGHYQNVIFYSMNFFARSIQDVLEDLPCSNYGQKLNVCYQMLQGILELQRLGYAHGDLKPANYMQKRLNDNLLRIVGFGFVQKFGAKRPAGCGTLEYMSLPALRGQEVSMVDDMQSWFHCCVVVLTGEFAYSRPTPDETEGLVELYLKAQTEDVPQYPSKDDEIIAMLRDLIWDKPPGNTIDMAAVSKTLDEFRDKFEFKYTDPWWDSLPVEKPSSAKSGKQSETTKKSKKS